jgi:3-oxoacyl-[acyl-carrier protein] reductase
LTPGLDCATVHATMSPPVQSSRLADRVAVVTGAGRGIGRAIAERFAAEGAAVVIAELNAETGAQAAQDIEAAGGRAQFVSTDVSDRATIDRMVAATVEAFGGLHILVNNAGVTGYDGAFLELSSEQWDRVLRINQSGVFHCSQAAARVMAPAKGGVILNMSSVNGFVPQPRCAAYGATKGALVSLTRAMATDLAGYGIRVNAIAPGAIQVESDPEAAPQRDDMALVQRFGLPAEVAAAAAFLCSDEAAYITGHILPVDGGTLVNAWNIYRHERVR